MIQFFQRHQFAGVELASHAAVENRQRLGPDVFAQQEVFVKSEPERLVVVWRGPMPEFIVPAIDEQSPVIEIADGRLPLITPLEMTAFDDAAARETQEAGFSSLSNLTRSERNPFARFCQVSFGYSEIRSMSTVPRPSASTLSRALVSVPVLRIVDVYFFQSPASPEIFVLPQSTPVRVFQYNAQTRRRSIDTTCQD